MQPYKSLHIIAILISIAIQGIVFAETPLDTLRKKIDQIVEHSAGHVGVAVINLNNRDTLTVNENLKFPMQSVFKFPLVLAVLHQVDKGKFSLDQRIHLNKFDLLPNTWSPLKEKYPNGNVDITIDELVTATMAQSDNNGCDILFRLVGGTNVVDQYIHTLGLSRIAIAATEQEMSKGWNIQYSNWSSPYTMGILLSKFYSDSILSQKSTEYLWHLMVNTVTGLKRLKGKLPEGTVVGHKTGSSGTNENGFAAATNDGGIILLPNKTPVVVVVFVSDSNANEKTREEVIADIAKAIWDVYSNK